jgi:hypothetical protein
MMDITLLTISILKNLSELTPKTDLRNQKQETNKTYKINEKSPYNHKESTISNLKILSKISDPLRKTYLLFSSSSKKKTQTLSTSKKHG